MTTPHPLGRRDFQKPLTLFEHQSATSDTPRVVGHSGQNGSKVNGFQANFEFFLGGPCLASSGQIRPLPAEGRSGVKSQSATTPGGVGGENLSQIQKKSKNSKKKYFNRVFS